MRYTVRARGYACMYVAKVRIIIKGLHAGSFCVARIPSRRVARFSQKSCIVISPKQLLYVNRDVTCNHVILELVEH